MRVFALQIVIAAILIKEVGSVAAHEVGLRPFHSCEPEEFREPTWFSSLDEATYWYSRAYSGCWPEDGDATMLLLCRRRVGSTVWLVGMIDIVPQHANGDGNGNESATGSIYHMLETPYWAFTDCEPAGSKASVSQT